MSDAILNEIYQELYAIRSELQSMNVRTELAGIRAVLDEIRSEIMKLNRSIEESSAGGPEGDIKGSSGRFGFLK